MLQKIVCFGETLWDILPSGKLPGGAPMNVAINLRHNGFDPVVLSRVGNDDLGKELISFLEEQKINTEWIQTGQTHLTGVVKANISDRNEVTYKIVEPVAWDYIQYEERIARLISESDVFIYGSLVARSPLSQETLLQYLPLAKTKVFDVNLRPPHYTPERVLALLGLATIVKMNHQELEEICGWLGSAGDFAQKMQAIKDQYELELVIVTRGDEGAAALTREGYFEHEGFQVEVEDTIGSGDAFLATFLTNYFQQKPLSETLERACLIGAYVATQRGATPLYDPQEITPASLTPSKQHSSLHPKS
ncbi:carbohydrate kinase family protein [Rufibacter latericius]|uniref:Carbohydrate kinase n=1 Tax=Rufibacter latericius TaxID=2487040 RepID=A0A3M9MU01_9BACT|nr:carbohydrate kinase [Rufibacter latericius]RNI29001.1 carbohydrate kinase [Rufibacter latericius]